MHGAQALAHFLHFWRERFECLIHIREERVAAEIRNRDRAHHDAQRRRFHERAVGVPIFAGHVEFLRVDSRFTICRSGYVSSMRICGRN